MTEPARFPLIDERTETPDGIDRSSLDLIFQSDGSLRLDGVYSGPRAKAFWGDWDHEFWIDIAAEDAQAVLAMIARDAFTHDACLTYTALRDRLTAAGIPFVEGSWT